MGHRHLLSSSKMFENDHEHERNHLNLENPYISQAISGPFDGRSVLYPSENLAVEGFHCDAQWSSVTRPNSYTSMSPGMEVSHYPSDSSGPSYDPFLYSSAGGAFCGPPPNYVHAGSSSNYDGPTWIDGGFESFDDLMRGPQKRKSPGVSPVRERGSSSKYYGNESSSDLTLSTELRLEKPNLESQIMPWDHISHYHVHRSTGLSIRGEGSSRNVRSRPTHDFDSSLARTYWTKAPTLGPYATSHLIDHAVEFPGQTSGRLTRESNHVRPAFNPGGMIISDVSGFRPDANNFLSRGNAATTPGNINGYHHDLMPSRNSIAAQNMAGPSTQSLSSVPCNYAQRPIPGLRPSSSSIRLEHVTPSDERLQTVAVNYPPRHPRPLSHMSWRGSERSGRSRISYDRVRSLPEEAALHDQFSSEGFMMIDRSAAYHAPRHTVDQHRDMRLDIDDMTYEELLALEERIGNVNTGLSEDSISKCLIQTIYCSSNQCHEGERCAICLEEYKDMDDVGVLRTCSHNYHVSCIKKWLSMKNLCPICKASALADDDMKK